MNKIDVTSIDVVALMVVLNYLEESEKQSYGEYLLEEFENNFGQDCENKEFYNNPNVVHIYAYARRLKDSITASVI